MGKPDPVTIIELEPGLVIVPRWIAAATLLPPRRVPMGPSYGWRIEVMVGADLHGHSTGWVALKSWPEYPPGPTFAQREELRPEEIWALNDAKLAGYEAEARAMYERIVEAIGESA